MLFDCVVVSNQWRYTMVPMVIFLYGSDTYRLAERAKALKAGFIKKYDPTGNGVSTLLAQEILAEQIPSKLLSGGLFSTKRCVVLKDVFNVKDKAAEILVTTLDKVDADSVIICTAEKLPKPANALSARLLKAGRVEEFKSLEPLGVTQWLKQQVAAKQATIDAAAVQYLVQACGSNLWRLNNVVNQLADYNPTITLETANLFVESALDDDIFHFTDALAERNAARAISLLHQQLESGANPFYLLTMLARQASLLLQVKAGGKAAEGLHPYVVKKTMMHAERFSQEQLVHLYQQLTEADLKLKSTSLSEAVLLDQLVVTFCQAQR